MTVTAFIERWKGTAAFWFSVLAIIFSTTNFWRQYFYVKDDLQATVIGEIDLPQGTLSLRIAVVNAGTRDAAVTQAELVAVKNYYEGYSWVRLPITSSFEPKTVKPGEIAMLSLITPAYAQDYFRNDVYGRAIDATHHEFTDGVRIMSMDSGGRRYSLLFPVSQFKICNDYTRGPTEGYTFDCHPHQLFINLPETIPPLAAKYDGDAYDCH